MRKRVLSVAGLTCFLGLVGSGAALADDPPLAAYFRAETARLAARPLDGIDSAAEWKARRPELQRQLREMLGLDPLPDRTDLHATVTGTAERPDFVIEKLHFQSSPSLYVTANLYRPKDHDKPLPAVLYVCGHSKVEKNGVIYGNKTHYQHHAAWYAANGFVCLVLDTLQLGELPGLHHGTYREKMWWWQARGYTPAGIEAWNAVRAIDYLVSRPDVDATKIAVTGRSGGGATSWWVGAIDDRVAAVVPVAGITDLQNHVVDGVIEGHCDCMYPVNTYRWDFPLVAALVAPKALLVENTDKDPIFPEDGVRRIYAQLEKVYGWYGASDRLGLVIGKGGHVDSAEIRHPSYAFMNKWLRGQTGPIDEPDRHVPIEDLKVLERREIPPGNRNATIQETFLAPSAPATFPGGLTDDLREQWQAKLRAKVFRGWPTHEAAPLHAAVAVEQSKQGIRFLALDFDSQEGMRLRLWYVGRADESLGRSPVTLIVLNPSDWEGKASDALRRAEQQGWNRETLEGLLDDLSIDRNAPLAVMAPRGVGLTGIPAAKETHVRRRFALLGQTLDGMRVWDIRRAIAALQTIDGMKDRPIKLAAKDQAAALALFAAIFEPSIASLTLRDLPSGLHDGPTFLNQERVLDLPGALALLAPRRVSITGTAHSLGPVQP